jgi:peroxiredoxin
MYKCIGIIVIVLHVGCLNKQINTKRQITIEGFPVVVGSLFLEQLDIKDNSYHKIDSIQFSNELVQRSFIVDDSSGSIFRIRVKNSLVSIPFVFDGNFIKLKLDFGRPSNYVFENSPLNTSIKKLMLNYQQDDLLAFIDTVSNAAAFMLVYSYNAFHSSTQKKVLQKAVQKFTNHAGIASLHKSFLNYETMQQKELNVGDTLPKITLPDENGSMYSTASLTGKPYMIFFWSTWCNQCIDYFSAIKKIKESGKALNVEMVSIAIDKEVQDWKSIIKEQPFISKKMIDNKMWEGITANTFYIDSIPFNFLVSAKGKILSKAIAPHQIQDTLLKYFPN